MIETVHLVIMDRQPGDVLVEEFYIRLNPEINELDPIIGESRDPVFYSIFLKESNTHIGTCCLYNLTFTGVELGIRIFIPEYWNRGYGGEVVEGLCSYAFNAFPQITSVLAKTPVYNTRAIKCYEKCGFTKRSQALLEGYNMVFMVKES